MEKTQTQLGGDEWATGSFQLLKLHVIHTCLQEHQRMFILFCEWRLIWWTERKRNYFEKSLMYLRETRCCWRWVEDSGWEEEWRVLLKSLGELSQLCLVSMDRERGAGSGSGLARVTRLNKGQYQPILSHTWIPLLLLNVWTTDSNSTGVKQSFTSLFQIILAVKNTNPSWESKEN